MYPETDLSGWWTNPTIAMTESMDVEGRKARAARM